MAVVPIATGLSVAAQPSLEEIGALARSGFKALINLRPDGEEPGQPGHAAEKAAAEAAGLSYGFVPVVGTSMTEADVRAFQAAVVRAEGLVVAHCTSGMRALTLYVLGEVMDGRMARDDVVSFGRTLAFDLSGATTWLDREMSRSPQVKGFFDARTSSVQYVVSDPRTKCCAIIDAVLDFDEKSGAIGTMNADALLAYVAQEGLSIEWILDTHPHADHFSAAYYLKQKCGAPTAIGTYVADVQRLWKGIYNSPAPVSDGSQWWDRLFADGDRFSIGTLEGRVIFSPGHTLASVTYLIADAAFIHDTLFMPDSGTARADFPGGSAKALWASIQTILSLPDATRLFIGHDYQPGGRHPRWESTVDAEKLSNPHLAGVDESTFVQLRKARDRTLPVPKLMLHALQVNMRGGRLPDPEPNGRRYLKFPLDALQGATW